MKNPIMIVLIILIVLVIGLIVLQLFGKQTVALDGTTGKIGYFGMKPAADPDPETPAPTTTTTTTA